MHASWRVLPAALLLMLVLVSSAAASRADIRTVTVARDRAGTLEFLIAFSGDVTLDSHTKLQVMLDTDRDSLTGIDGAEYALDYSHSSPGLVVAEDGESRTVLSSLQFSSDARSVMFRIAAADVGDPAKFDFWVFIQQNGDVVDNAPTHVLLSPSDDPWTYPQGDVPAAGEAYPVETYTDLSDTSVEDFPWVTLLLGLLGLGAVVALAGWTWEKLRKKAPPAKPLGAG